MLNQHYFLHCQLLDLLQYLRLRSIPFRLHELCYLSSCPFPLVSRLAAYWDRFYFLHLSGLRPFRLVLLLLDQQRATRTSW